MWMTTIHGNLCDNYLVRAKKDKEQGRARTSVRNTAGRSLTILTRQSDEFLAPRLVLAQKHVEEPTAADMLRATAAVRQHVHVGAAGLLQGVRQDGHVGERPPVVDVVRQRDHRPAVPSHPGGV